MSGVRGTCGRNGGGREAGGAAVSKGTSSGRVRTPGVGPNLTHEFVSLERCCYPGFRRQTDNLTETVQPHSLVTVTGGAGKRNHIFHGLANSQRGARLKEYSHRTEILGLAMFG